MCLRDQTHLEAAEKVVPQARGRVLEIGMGAGHNLPYYRAEQVERIVGIDPCSTSWALAQPRATSLGVPLEFIEGSAESMPLPDEEFDTVLMTYSLCTIPDAQAALQEIRRVLKPGGAWCFANMVRRPIRRSRALATKSQSSLAKAARRLHPQSPHHALDK